MGLGRIDRWAVSAGGLAAVGGRRYAERLYRADRWPARTLGLLGTADLTPAEALWLEPCSAVHTWGMRIPIACAFVDAEGVVLRVVDPLAPWRAAACIGARSVVEMRAGSFADLAVGARLAAVADHVLFPNSEDLSPGGG